MRFKQTVSGLLFIFIVCVTPAMADLKVTDPKSVSSYLADMGLKTGDWKRNFGAQYISCSQYVDIGSGFPLRNNIAYYVFGTRKKAEILKLVLNVNNKGEAKAAHKELLKASAALVQKALGITLPLSITQAIDKGVSVTVKAGSASIGLLREDWSTGKGYDLKLTIK